MRHFIENCNDNGFSNFRFSIYDCLTNVEGLIDDEIHDLLLFCIRALVMQHHVQIASMTSLFHDGGRYHIQTSPFNCSVNQWTGF